MQPPLSENLPFGQLFTMHDFGPVDAEEPVVMCVGHVVQPVLWCDVEDWYWPVGHAEHTPFQRLR